METATQDIEAGEESPLIGVSEDKPLKDIEESTRTEQAVAGFSAVSFGASVAAMLFNRNPVVLVSGIIGAGIAPYAAIQQQKITEVDALAETNERVREEVDQLKGENVKLQQQVASLSESVENLKIQKEKLDTINSVQGLSLDELENQLKESKKILDKMELNLQGDILGNLMDIALACDEDGDFELSDDEIEDVITQLEELNGVDIDNDRLRNVLIERGRSVEGIMDVIKNLLRDDIPEEENLFHFISK